MPTWKLYSAILLPPMAVALCRGRDLQFRLNIPLTILGYIPGMVHAIWIVAHRNQGIDMEIGQ